MNVQLFGDWEGSGIEALENEYGDYDKPVTGHFNGDAMVGIYSYEDYSGIAHGFVRRGSEIFEFGGSHCSCNGLEGQHELSPVTVAYIREQLENGWLAEKQESWDSFPQEQWTKFRAAVKELIGVD